MNYENPEIKPRRHVSTDEAIRPGAPDFIETPEVSVRPQSHEPLPLWLYLACGFALFMAGSSFAGFETFGRGLCDQGPGAPSVVNKSSGPVTVVSTDPMVLGKKVYGSYCASCHQSTGMGQPGKYPPMVGSEWVLGSKERVAAIVLHGLAGPLQVKSSPYGSEQMAPWNSLSDEQIAHVITYIRASWGNTADAATKEEVAAARTKFTSQSSTFTEAELLKIAPHGAEGDAKK